MKMQVLRMAAFCLAAVPGLCAADAASGTPEQAYLAFADDEKNARWTEWAARVWLPSSSQPDSDALRMEVLDEFRGRHDAGVRLHHAEVRKIEYPRQDDATRAVLTVERSYVHPLHAEPVGRSETVHAFRDAGDGRWRFNVSACQTARLAQQDAAE